MRSKAYYDRYRRILAQAQAQGDGLKAKRAARMLLLHLRKQFQALPLEKKHLVKLNLLMDVTG